MFLPFYFVLYFSVSMQGFQSMLVSEEAGILSFFLMIAENFWIIFLTMVVFGYIWAYLTYQNYKYELTPNGFRKESGVIWKQYVTIPYQKIQNVDIYRGLLARILGLSDLQIQTAGASASFDKYGAVGAGAEGRLPGISMTEAEKLRDELIKRA